MLRNIIFDWSGTLVDDLLAVWQATNFVLSQAGLPEFSLDQFRNEFCLPFTRFYERHLAHVPMAQLEEWFHSSFREAQDSVEALPHAHEFLLFCRERRLRTFLLSTVHKDHFAVQSAKTGFGEFLDCPYLGIWDKRTKILEILETHALKPDETLFIGDMQHDIDTAKHGGIFSCAVLTGYNNLAQLRASQPDLIVEHLGELRQILERSALQFIPGGGAMPHAAHCLPTVTVGALVFKDDGQVLMIRTHKWSNLWGIPGGKIKFGESSTAALRREVKEETNLDIREIEFVLVQDCIHSPEFYREAHFVLLNYTCRCAGDVAVKLNCEAQDFRWVSLAEAQALPLNQPTRILLQAMEPKRPSRSHG